MPKFTCHSVMSNKSPISYCIIGEGRFYKGTFLESVKGRVRLEYPMAEFRDSFDVDWSEVPLLRQKAQTYEGRSS